MIIDGLERHKRATSMVAHGLGAGWGARVAWLLRGILRMTGCGTESAAESASEPSSTPAGPRPLAVALPVPLPGPLAASEPPAGPACVPIGRLVLVGVR